MTGTAWAMMLGAWTFITFFTAKFFLMVLRTPPKKED